MTSTKLVSALNAMVLGECFFVAIKEIPVQSCEWTCGIAGA
jgi:hypothetical protein